MSDVWGSDIIARALREVDLPYVALNPGASYRGLHDSLVNLLGNERPRMLVFLHEEHAVACAHGYAKVTGRPMGVVLHSNVGLMHGAMAIYNAYCDRVPMMIIGATGPLDAAKRRPWIDWLHTAADQASIIRPYIKWDDQPTSVRASVESLLRGSMLTRTAPKAPVYVVLDAAVQEALVPDMPIPPVERYASPAGAQPDDEVLDRAVRLLRKAERPLILMGRVSRSQQAWDQRVALAEALGAAVVTDAKAGAAFPSVHPLHVGAPGYFLDTATRQALGAADVVLALDWIDLGGTLAQAYTSETVTSTIVSVSVDLHLHAGWSRDYGSLPPVDVPILAEPDVAVPLLLARLSEPNGAGGGTREPWVNALPPVDRAEDPDTGDGGEISMAALAAALRTAVAGSPVCLVRLPLGWSGHLWDFDGPLDYLGYDGGGGIGSGPGMSVGAALALRDTDVLPVAVLGDGDFLMGATALWTAVVEKLPLLVVVANNRSYFNDELHQDRVAVQRDRPRENRSVGQRIEGPTVELTQLAQGQGARVWGPVTDPAQLPAALAEAAAAARNGAVAFVDVWVERRYDAEMAAGLVRAAAGAEDS